MRSSTGERREEVRMHIQIRTSLGTASDTRTGSGAMELTPIEVDPLELKQRALLELLQLLADNDYDLAMAGGDSIEGGGEFVFALKHEDAAEGSAHTEDDRSGDCAALLKSNGYRNVRLIEPRLCEVDDQVGALRDCIAEIVADGRRIDEIYVGAPHDGKIPVQITTIRTV
jgi:hypothetical protein